MEMWYIALFGNRISQGLGTFVKVLLLLILCAAILLTAAQVVGPKETYDHFTSDAYLILQFNEPTTAADLQSTAVNLRQLPFLYGFQTHTTLKGTLPLDLVSLDEWQFVSTGEDLHRQSLLAQPGFLIDNTLIPDNQRFSLRDLTISADASNLPCLGLSPYLRYVPSGDLIAEIVEQAFDGIRLPPDFELTPDDHRERLPAIYLPWQTAVQLDIPLGMLVLQFKTGLSAAQRSQVLSAFSKFPHTLRRDGQLEMWSGLLGASNQSTLIQTLPILVLLFMCLVLQMVVLKLWILEFAPQIRVCHLCGFPISKQRRLLWLLIMAVGLFCFAANILMFRPISIRYIEPLLKSDWSSTIVLQALSAYLLGLGIYVFYCIKAAVNVAAREVDRA